MVKQTKIVLYAVVILLYAFSEYAYTETVRYGYDSARQLVKVTYDDRAEIDYKYDTSGNRFSKTIALEISVPEKDCLQPVRILRTPPSYYTGIQDAYDAAQNGDNIQGRDIEFYEDLLIEQDKSVHIEGGFNCDYSSNTGFSIIRGSMRIIGEGIIIDRVKIRE